jgi:hypothetical protein
MDEKKVMMVEYKMDAAVKQYMTGVYGIGFACGNGCIGIVCPY